MVVVGNARLDASRQADENCLKAILLIHMDKGRAYVSDLAEVLGIALTTAYSSANRLVDAGYICPLERRGGRKSNKQTLVLTPAGEEIATKVLDKHQRIQRWLMRLGVPENEADEEACHWEHSITDRTMEVIERHVEAAMRIGRGDSSATELMSAMTKALGAEKQGDGTACENLITLLDRYGGAEGIRRKGELSARAGGDGALEDIIGFSEALGGSKVIKEQGDDIIRLKKQTDLRGGSEKLLMDMELFDAAGGEAQLERFVKLAETLGGAEKALDILEKSCAIWSGAFDSDGQQS